jgi:hypothetical protein
VIGYSRITHGTQKNGVVIAKPCEAIRRHHVSGGFVRLAIPVEVTETCLEAELRARRFEDAQRRGHDLLANAITWDDSDTIGAHE